MSLVRLDRVAHGGHVVGRLDGKVVFVTGGLPGELVEITLTEQGRRFDRADVVRVVEPSPHRVEPPCPVADRCGGCDWQHVNPDHQLELKRQVVAEQLHRLAGIDWDGQVTSLGPAEASRSRMRYSVTPDGRVGLRARRSHEIVPLPAAGCLVSRPESRPVVLDPMAGQSDVVTVASQDGLTVVSDGEVVQGSDPVTHRVGKRLFAVAASGFWQVHPRAPEVLTDAVLRALRPQAGERALDLYCGVGLFAGALVAAGCSVTGVEQSRSAVRQARLNVPGATFLARSLERIRELPAVDLVVVDPPRRGLDAGVVERLASLAPRALAYVSCDPATLARDLGRFAELGYRTSWLEAFDLFPMTHHIECVALLEPTPAGTPSGSDTRALD